ncbi:MAG: hypothetical protein E7316_03660 [Clostridiales bacterium]|nr:hypothetical protein [Clostridiales bacterium]
MRKSVRVKGITMVALALLLAAVCSAALAAQSYPFSTVTNDQVNLRRNASSTSAILASIPEGSSLTVEGRQGNYYKVTYNGRTGYVIKKYVVTDADAITTPAPTAEPTATGYPYETTTSDQVNLRAKASVYSQKLASIPEGATITVKSVSGKFAKVEYKGEEGYCQKDYINLKKIVKATATPKPVETLSPQENASSYVVLQKGSTGSHVTALQEALIELDFLSGKADGVFGAGTEKAVIAFQQKNEYPDTGVVDANLQAFLYSGKPKNAKGTKTTIKTLAPVSGVIIRLNNKGELVETVQTRLQELGYYAGEISGTYDKATQAAVKAFQKKNDLKADGVCGSQTQTMLLSGSAVSATATATPAPTATPTPAPTFQVPEKTVRKGSSGADAKLVQQRLKDLGYLTGKVDGEFGVISVTALKTFQSRNGLTADGEAGTATCKVLFSTGALAADQLATPAPTAQTTAAPTTTYAPITRDNVVTVKLGVTGDAVSRLQTRLTELGYYNANVDGKCKADDVAAIKVFQKKNGLTADGVAGYNTQVKLYSVTALTSTGAIAGGTVDSFTTLRKGDVSNEVKEMQERLIELGYLSGKADGNYGRQTFEAVYAFQKANGLSRDGVAGAATLSKLYSATTAQAQATATPAPATTTLRKGDANSAVKEMQERLIKLGYLSGNADGDFGVQTYRALVSFQKSNKLDADGIAGAKTLAALNSANAISAGGSGSSTGSGTTVTTPSASVSTQYSASRVQYLNWYTSIKAQAKKYPYATVYDFSSGISWQVHMFSLGAHADAEPLTAADTAKLEKAFGGNTWTPKAVWVVFGDGSIYMASTHSMPHDPQHRTDNNFDGHLCIHFPRTAAQVASIGPYATSHQNAIDAGWTKTQDMIR